MKLSLSVRIVEAPCKTKLNLPFEQIVEIARDTGYSAICLRASAAGVGVPQSQLEAMRKAVDDAGLKVSMVTADSDVPLNNENGPNSLRHIVPSLDIAEAMGADLIRVCLKKREDIPFARSAADEAARRKIRLAHQCHTATIFEEVGPMLEVLQVIDRPNFGLIYEPANLMVCGQSYGVDTMKRLRPHLMNVYVQNHRLNPRGADFLNTYCRGEVRFDHLDPWDEGGIDFPAVCRGLNEVDAPGFFTIHQAQGIVTADDAKRFAQRCSDYFGGLFAGMHS